MDAQTPEAKTQATPAEAPKLSQLREVSKQARPPALAALTALYVLLARSFRIPRPLSELVMRATAIRGMI